LSRSIQSVEETSINMANRVWYNHSLEFQSSLLHFTRTLLQLGYLHCISIQSSIFCYVLGSLNLDSRVIFLYESVSSRQCITSLPMRCSLYIRLFRKDTVVFLLFPSLGIGTSSCCAGILQEIGSHPCNRLLGPKINLTKQDAETYNAARDQS
jgi:hypothetical protein